MSTLAELNALPHDRAVSRLLDACGSRRWAEGVAAARPFADTAALATAADLEFAHLVREDWLEAFAAHPRIGARAGGAHGGSQSGRGESWSAHEQSAAGDASGRERAALDEGNDRYFERFGYTFIVRAAGRSAGEMLALLEQRLHNDPERELDVAAAQQREITRLRLDKMLAS